MRGNVRNTTLLQGGVMHTTRLYGDGDDDLDKDDGDDDHDGDDGDDDDTADNRVLGNH